MNKILAILKNAVMIPTEAPESFQVLPHGPVHIEGEGAPLLMDDTAAMLVIENFESLDHDMVIDYEHQTLTGAKAPAAGWISSLTWRGKEGLWAEVGWTEEAAGYIAKKEYRYHSPVMLSRKSDRRVVQLYNLALTNQPRIMNIAAIAAKQSLFGDQEEEMIQKLRKLFNLPETATEADVMAAANTVVAKNTELLAQASQHTEVIACKGVMDALKLPNTANEAEALAAITRLSASTPAAQDLSLQVAKLSTQIAEMKRDDLVTRALKNGQTSPDELTKWGRDLAKNNPEQFELIVLSRPIGSVIPIENSRVVGETAGGAVTDDVQLSINKMMGIDTETFKKYGPKESDR